MEPKAEDGHREVTLMREQTQRLIAISVVAVTVGVAAFKALYDTWFDAAHGVAAGPAFIFLVGAANLVIGYYFGKRQRAGEIADE